MDWRPLIIIKQTTAETCLFKVFRRLLQPLPSAACPWLFSAPSSGVSRSQPHSIFSLPLFVIFFVDFRTSQALGNQFQVYIDGKPVTVSLTPKKTILPCSHFVSAARRSTELTLFIKRAKKPVLRFQDSATTSVCPWLAIVACASSRSKAFPNP